MTLQIYLILLNIVSITPINNFNYLNDAVIHIKKILKHYKKTNNIVTA